MHSSTIGMQGCPVSPVLFGLYMELQHASHAQDASVLLGQTVPISLYADDTVLLVRSPSGLQHIDLSRLQDQLPAATNLKFWQSHYSLLYSLTMYA